MKKTILYNSESNGKAERTNRVLLERARSLLYESEFPIKFWAEAINYSTQVSNIYHREMEKKKKPLEIWTGEKSNLNYVRKFGCLDYRAGAGSTDKHLIELEAEIPELAKTRLPY